MTLMGMEIDVMQAIDLQQFKNGLLRAEIAEIKAAYRRQGGELIETRAQRDLHHAARMRLQSENAELKAEIARLEERVEEAWGEGWDAGGGWWDEL